MSIKDVIKKSVYDNFAGDTGLSLTTIVLILIESLLIGLYIYEVYKRSSKQAFYSKDLNITIAGMPIIITAIMLAMQSNILVSLGMVGALSIVRFRTAVKNPLDLLYLFWAISAGIICGVGLFALTVTLCIVVTCLILILQMIPQNRASSVLLLGTTKENVEWVKVSDIVKGYSKNVKEKSKSIRNGYTEVIYEFKTGKEDELLEVLKKEDYFDSIQFLSHDGEYRI